MAEFMDYNSALSILSKAIKPYTKIEKVGITQALNRYIADDIVAKFDYPLYPTSAMDGYAFAYSDDISIGSKLKIVANIPAGSSADIEILHGQCAKTFTGSLISKGCDTLIPIENVDVDGEYITIKKPVPRHFAVRMVGESYKAGEILIKKGTKIGYAQIAILAELGEFHISVFIKPRVAILSTGSEIRDLGENLQYAWQIRGTNHITLATMAYMLGCEAIICPIVKDEKHSIKLAFENALSSADIVVSTGGVSVGDYDFMSDIVGDYEILINKVAIKPGRHIKIAKSADKLIFALPGFALAATITFRLFVKFSILAMLGNEDKKLSAFIGQNYIKKTQLTEFVPCRLICENGKNYIDFVGKKSGSSAIINNLSDDAYLAVIRPNSNLEIGSVVEIIEI